MQAALFPKADGEHCKSLFSAESRKSGLQARQIRQNQPRRDEGRMEEFPSPEMIPTSFYKTFALEIYSLNHFLIIAELPYL